MRIPLLPLSTIYLPSNHELIYHSILVCNLEYNLGALRYIQYIVFPILIIKRIYELTNKARIAKNKHKDNGTRSETETKFATDCLAYVSGNE